MLHFWVIHIRVWSHEKNRTKQQWTHDIRGLYFVHLQECNDLCDGDFVSTECIDWGSFWMYMYSTFFVCTSPLFIENRDAQYGFFSAISMKLSHPIRWPASHFVLCIKHMHALCYILGTALQKWQWVLLSDLGIGSNCSPSSKQHWCIIVH